MATLCVYSRTPRLVSGFGLGSTFRHLPHQHHPPHRLNHGPQRLYHCHHANTPRRRTDGRLSLPRSVSTTLLPVSSYKTCFERFPLEDYVERRRRLASALPPRSLAVVAASTEIIMSNDIPYRFRQDSDFLYLTGFDEGNAFLLLETDERRQLAHSTLLVQPKDPSREMWDGYRAGPDAAQAQTGVDAAYDLSHIETALSARRTGAVRYGPVLTTSTLHRLSATSNAHARTVAAVQRTAASAQGHDARRPLPLEPHLQRLRLRKSVGELEVLRCAAAVSTAAMTAAMRSTQAETNERQLDALIEYEMRLRGASALAYPPVVAGGARANTLHYVRNDQELCDGEMVLVDAGAEYGGYCADITRVWPVGGRFSAPQAALYNAVLAVQRQCLAALAAEEVRTLQALGSLAQHVLLDELLQLGLVRASATVDAQRTALQQLMPHSIGHYLGMDVHDCGTVSTLAELGAGVVLTIEPGVYVPDVPSVPAEFRGMGIRIEDDVVMSYGGGVENLTHACAKTIAEVEATCHGTMDAVSS